MKIEEIDFEMLGRALQGLSFDEALDILGNVMITLMQNIKNVANAYAKLQDEIAVGAEKVKSVEKMVDYGLSRRGMIKSILKGESRSMMDMEFFRKERDKIKAMTKELSYVV